MQKLDSNLNSPSVGSLFDHLSQELPSLGSRAGLGATAKHAPISHERKSSGVSHMVQTASTVVFETSKFAFSVQLKSIVSHSLNGVKVAMVAQCVIAPQLRLRLIMRPTYTLHSRFTITPPKAMPERCRRRCCLDGP